MNENGKRVLRMLSEGKVTVDEAERLLYLVEEEPKAPRPTHEALAPRTGPAKYLRVMVDENGSGAHVNVRVPLALIKAGVKMHTLVPDQAATGINEALRRNGVDVDVHNLRTESLEQLVDALGEIEVDMHDGDERIRVYCE